MKMIAILLAVLFAAGCDDARIARPSDSANVVEVNETYDDGAAK